MKRKDRASYRNLLYLKETLLNNVNICDSVDNKLLVAQVELKC